jgi:hypothetical protein
MTLVVAVGVGVAAGVGEVGEVVPHETAMLTQRIADNDETHRRI